MDLGGVTLEEDEEGGVLVKLQDDPETLADIESIWKKLEVPIRSPETDAEHDIFDGVNGINFDMNNENSDSRDLKLKSAAKTIDLTDSDNLLAGDCGSPINPFESSEELVYVDPFTESVAETSDADLDSEVDRFDLPRKVGREFSLSQYDLNVKRQIYRPIESRGYRPIEVGKTFSDFTGSESYVSSHTEEEEEVEGEIREHDDFCESLSCHGECLSGSKHNYLNHHGNHSGSNLRNRNRQSESDVVSNTSGHVICDCNDCINQTEAVDCQCENCLAPRGKSHSVAEADPTASMVTCDCDDCLRNPEESLNCQCEQCLTTNNNNSPEKFCQCAECVGEENHYNDACNCTECRDDLNNSKNSNETTSSSKGQRVSPLGRSQEPESLETGRYEYNMRNVRSNSLGERSRLISDVGAKYRNIESKNRINELVSKNKNIDPISTKLNNVHFNAKSRNGEDTDFKDRRDLVFRSDLRNSTGRDLFSKNRNLDVNLLRRSTSDADHFRQGVVQSFEGKVSQSTSFRREPSIGQNLRRSETMTTNSRKSSSGRSSDHEEGCSDRSGDCVCAFCESRQSSGRVGSARFIMLLEDQLQKTEQDLKKKTHKYESELIDLKKENDKQHKLIQQSLSLGPDAKIEATMQHEITRLTSENLDLREVIDKQAEQIRKLKKMLKVYAKRLKDGEAAEIQAELEQEETNSVKNVAQIKHRERNYMGMLEYKKEDEGSIIKALVIDLKPRVASGLMPGLPAYLLFMCVRHTDYINDDEKVRSFLTNSINSIKKVVKKHHDDLDRVTMLLANTCRFLHTLKQYSGEKQFQTENTPRQNEHCLRNFDLGEYRQVFSDLAVWIYQTLIKLMEATIQPSIVAAVLEHEAIAGLTGSKPGGMRGRTSSVAQETPEHSLDSLMKSMNHFVRILTAHAVDPELVKQIFRQLYYFLAASALNNLLLRKDMCNWSKGMQVRYNLSHLEQWLRDNKLQESGAVATLDPIIQASQLLQARKTDADVDSVCDMCSNLTVPQIVKILNLYTPVDEFEERVPISFIRKLQEKLKTRDNKDNSLLADLKFSFPVTFPFNPSKIALETIEVPEVLHLSNLITRL